MHTILITGVGGMVGSHMVDYFVARGIKPIGLYFNSTIRIEEIVDKAELAECDIRDFQRVLHFFERHRPQIVYHLAAQSFPTVSWERPAETVDINMIGTINVCEAVKILRARDRSYDPTIVVACSSAEYGASLTSDRVPIDEDAPLLPLHPYGVSKVGQDLLAFQYHHSDGLRTIRARIFNTTGPRKIGDAASDFVRGAVAIELGLKSALRVGNVSTKRALTDVRDLVQALILLAEKGEPGDVYNISGNRVIVIQEMLDIIIRQARVPLKIIRDPSLLRPTDEPVIYGNSNKLFERTGWKQEIQLEETIRDMLDYWRNRISREVR